MARTVRTIRSNKGFTLLEALFAIIILAFGLMAVVIMIDVSFSAGSLSKNTTRATELASWMVDRIRQDTSLATQIYTTNITSLQTYTGIDTNSTVDPVNEPGRTASQQWRALIQGLAVPSAGTNYMGANQLRGDKLPQGHGVVTITTNDPNRAGNHFLTVDVSFVTPGSVLPHHVILQTILAAP